MKGVCILVAALALLSGAPGAAAYDETITDGYFASVGATVLGAGAATNAGPLGPGRYNAAEAVTRVEVSAVDDSGLVPWLVVCVDVNQNNLCTESDGDFQTEGAGRVAIVVGLEKAFRQIQVYAYTLGVNDVAPNAASAGTLTVHFTS